MALNAKQKAALDNIAKSHAASAIEGMSGRQQAPIYKGMPPTFAYHQPGSAPAIITKSIGDGEFFLTRLFKAQREHNPDFAPYEYEMIEKAQQSSADASGGVLVPTQHIPQLIDILYANAPIRQLGGTVIPMTGQTAEIPRVRGGATSAYGAENATISETEGNLGMLQLVARNLLCLVPVSNSLIADAGPAAEGMVRNMIAKSMGLTETQKGITGAGGVEPVGIVNNPDVTTQSSVTMANLDFDDILDMIKIVENEESELTGFLTTPSIKNVLRKLKDPTTGMYLWRDTLTQKDLDTLIGRPSACTTRCRNEDTTTTHYIIGGNWQDEFVIGDRMTLEFDVSKERQFEKNITLIRCIARHDFAMRHPEAFVVLPVTGVS